MVTSVSLSVLLEQDELFTRVLRASDAAHGVVRPDSGGRDDSV
jgi:hypothetical protein